MRMAGRLLNRVRGSGPPDARSAKAHTSQGFPHEAADLLNPEQQAVRKEPVHV